MSETRTDHPLKTPHVIRCAECDATLTLAQVVSHRCQGFYEPLVTTVRWYAGNPIKMATLISRLDPFQYQL